MFGAKFIATSSTTVLLSGFHTHLFKKQLIAKCEEKKPSAAAQQGADDLEKILSGAEGGIPPDPEEIQELLMKAQGRSIR
jgi:hypothetical protein